MNLIYMYMSQALESRRSEKKNRASIPCLFFILLAGGVGVGGMGGITHYFLACPIFAGDMLIHHRDNHLYRICQNPSPRMFTMFTSG